MVGAVVIRAQRRTGVIKITVGAAAAAVVVVGGGVAATQAYMSGASTIHAQHDAAVIMFEKTWRTRLKKLPAAHHIK